MNRFMVSGTRLLGVCGHRDGRRNPCAVAESHRAYLAAVMRMYVHHHGAGGTMLELWHGDAPGADRMAGEYWAAFSLGPIHAVPANWAELGHRAGPVRNKLLVARMPDLLLAFPYDGRSPGTLDAIRQAQDAGVPTKIFPVGLVCPEAR